MCSRSAVSKATQRAQTSALACRKADAEDLLLLDDLLGIVDPDVPLPVIDPAARTRRLTALLKAAAVARTTPAIFVIEDAHWIDPVSEAMIASLAAVAPQTHVLMLITYRPEYHGALDRLPTSTGFPLPPFRIQIRLHSPPSCWDQTLRSHRSSHTLLNGPPATRSSPNRLSVTSLSAEWWPVTLVPIFPQHRNADVRVPASLQATIAARIDRIGPRLNAR